MVFSSPLVANVLPIVNLPMALGNLPIAANGLSLVPIGTDIREKANDKFLRVTLTLRDKHQHSVYLFSFKLIYLDTGQSSGKCMHY